MEELDAVWAPYKQCKQYADSGIATSWHGKNTRQSRFRTEFSRGHQFRFECKQLASINDEEREIATCAISSSQDSFIFNESMFGESERERYLPIVLALHHAFITSNGASQLVPNLLFDDQLPPLIKVASRYRIFVIDYGNGEHRQISNEASERGYSRLWIDPSSRLIKRACFIEQFSGDVILLAAKLSNSLDSVNKSDPTIRSRIETRFGEQISQFIESECLCHEIEFSEASAGS